MNIWHDMDPKQITPTDFSVVIEISKGSRCKYELDKSTGMLRLDRVLYTATHYPANYGFIPLTYADDDDPLDVLLICSEEIVPLTLVQCYPIGVIKMIVRADHNVGLDREKSLVDRNAAVILRLDRLNRV